MHQMRARTAKEALLCDRIIEQVVISMGIKGTNFPLHPECLDTKALNTLHCDVGRPDGTQAHQALQCSWSQVELERHVEKAIRISTGHLVDHGEDRRFDATVRAYSSAARAGSIVTEDGRRQTSTTRCGGVKEPPKSAKSTQERARGTAEKDVLELTWTLHPPGPPGPGLDPRPPSRGGA